MAKKSGWIKISGYLFLLGILIAVVDGLIPATIPYAGAILVLLGAVVGLLGELGMGSISRDESELFLLAVIALVAAGGSGAMLATIPLFGTYLSAMIINIGALVAPAAVILALEAIWVSGSTRF